jgi:hypothetical protein
MMWFGAHAGWVGFGIGVLVGICLMALVVGMLIASRETRSF